MEYSLLLILSLFLIITILIIPAMLGLVMIYHTFIRQKTPPADETNRINHIRLVWFALSREELFVDKFPWLKNDEMDNLK